MSTTKILMLGLYRSQGDQLHPVRLAEVTDLSSFKYDTQQQHHMQQEHGQDTCMQQLGEQLP